MINTPSYEYVDIHGLGKENCNGVPGLIHGVISPTLSRLCFEHNIDLDGTKSNLVDSKCLYPNYTGIYGKKRQLKCCIQTYLIDSNINLEEYRHKKVEIKDIMHSKVLEHKKDCDIWIILGTISKYAINQHLVNM
jgi:hypothetical protein